MNAVLFHKLPFYPAGVISLNQCQKNTSSNVIFSATSKWKRLRFVLLPASPPWELSFTVNYPFFKFVLFLNPSQLPIQYSALFLQIKVSVLSIFTQQSWFGFFYFIKFPILLLIVSRQRGDNRPQHHHDQREKGPSNAALRRVHAPPGCCGRWWRCE